MVVVPADKRDGAVGQDGPVVYRHQRVDGHFHSHLAVGTLRHVHARTALNLHTTDGVDGARFEIGAENRRRVGRLDHRSGLTRGRGPAILYRHLQATIDQVALLIDAARSASQESQIARLGRRHHVRHFP